MNNRKKFQELTIKDNFMFGAVMCDEKMCKQFLEMVLKIEIDHLEISKEKSLIYNPQYKGVRLDVYARDDENACYNVEMQAIREPEVGKRSRYYHSQIDMDLLLSGSDYAELPETYVIFICDYDPFGGRKYRYTFENTCSECEGVALNDGIKTIFLSTYGENPEDEPESVVKFLRFVKADYEESEKDYQDEFVERLQQAVRHVKQSRQMEERFMLLELEIKRERREGKAEGKAESVIELLEELGEVPQELQERIMQERGLDVLKQWLILSAKVDSIQAFVEQMQKFQN